MMFRLLLLCSAMARASAMPLADFDDPHATPTEEPAPLHIEQVFEGIVLEGEAAGSAASSSRE